MVEFGSGRGGRLKLRKLEHKVLVVNLDSSSSIPLNSVDTNRTTDVYAGGTNMDNAITISATTNMDNAITISATNSTPTQIKDSERGRRLKLQKLEQKVPVVVDLDSNSSIADNIVETKTTADVYACGTNLEDVIVIRSKNSTTTKKKGRNHLHVNDSRSRIKKSRFYIMKNTTCLKRRLFHLKRRNYRDCDRTEHIKKTVSERSRLASNQEVSTRMRRCSRGTSLLTRKHVVERRNSTYEEARSEPSFRKRKMVQIGTSRFQTKQTYYRYIQKKPSPKLFSNMLSELSGEQKKWVEKTGFGNVLAFRMKRGSFLWLKDSCLTCLPALKTLCLDNCDLSISSFSLSLPDLTTLRLSGCILAPTVWDFPAFLTVDLCDVDLPENISDIFSKLVNLQYLTLFFGSKSMERDHVISFPSQLLNLYIGTKSCFDLLKPSGSILVLVPKICNVSCVGIFTLVLGVLELENVNIKLQGWIKIYMEQAHKRILYRRFIYMLPGVGNAKNLTFDVESIKALTVISDFLGRIPSPFRNLKCVKLPRGYTESSIPSGLRSYLLGGSPRATIVTTLPT
ncbi:hypothetical protein POM88_002526 [Heracleum sosnowskyi]|uniref:Uncharacterized protein n=1 Tax=Heracleum sosnowskyi TaxID=360622 RepID=A0AAD8JFU9_9APIA|nr:hypothetical protein POM88_002526 [Heracleum sosnowskyi]